jgi:putative heme-binding domain-containing protein
MACHRRTFPAPFHGLILPVVQFGLLFTATCCLGQGTPLNDRLLEEPLAAIVKDAQAKGNPARGAFSFYQPELNCARCHEANQSGRRLGPDLTEKRPVDWQHLAQSLLQPSAQIKTGYETVQVLTLEGRMLSGILVEESDDQLIIDQIEQAEKPLVLAKDDLEAWKKTAVSTMPAGLVNQLPDRAALLDLVSYLAAVAEGGSSVADRLRPPSVALAPLPAYESRVDHARLIRDLNQETLAMGEEIFKLRCASCHGNLKQEGSMPTSLRFAEGEFKRGSDPYSMYQTLTHGFGMMVPQRWMVPRQKYAVIQYIRQHFLQTHNSDQHFEVTSDYLASLPEGDTVGPEPVLAKPWTAMDYGPSLNNTIEVSQDGSNIAQKGIVVRLDSGPGGVESGKHWMMYEHDTLRVAGAWSDSFVDYEGIHFNGAHNRHPRVSGNIQFANPTGPGFAKPDNKQTLSQRFEDQRIVGRDGKHYGPLPRQWARFEGLYRFGPKTILQYRIGQTRILESPGLTFDGTQPIYTRNLSLPERKEELIIQIASQVGERVDGDAASPTSLLVLPESGTNTDDSQTQPGEVVFDGKRYYQTAADPFDWFGQPFSIVAQIKTRDDGTILALTRDQSKWVSQGQTLFLRGGKPTFDIGWVGDVTADRTINDGQPHEVVMTSAAGQIDFWIDGKRAGGGQLKPEARLADAVLRVGKTNDNFPNTSAWQGQLTQLRFYQRKLSPAEVTDSRQRDEAGLVADWNHVAGGKLQNFAAPNKMPVATGAAELAASGNGLMVSVSMTQGVDRPELLFDGTNVRLRVPPGPKTDLLVAHASVADRAMGKRLKATASCLEPRDLEPMTQGGVANYPETLTTDVVQGESDEGPFAVDVFRRPTENPWNCRMRLTGIDFFPDSDAAIVTAWDGSVWKLTGLSTEQVQWRRFAYGLFQPLGVKIVAGKIYVICRDQLVRLVDLNEDGEADWYQNFNSDHQVTEHFHEFAAGLQVDDQGRFYYAKCARHAKPALVPQHGTLVRISADGSSSEILANGFRAPNGVCLNPDGTYFMTDQEGHWTPKNRINLVHEGGFYGNMMGYHDGVSEDDNAMEQPVCWITNAFDRSPSELVWVDSAKWGSLNGSLLNLSYGYGQIYVVLRQRIGDSIQGGMIRLPIERFPTGVMRGRFHPVDGQFYCCGMYAWAGNQQQPGGLYRIRYTGKPIKTVLGLRATGNQLQLTFSDPLDLTVASDAKRYEVRSWGLKRNSGYGSAHLNEQTLEVASAEVSQNGKRVTLTVPDLEPTRGMEIRFELQSKNGSVVEGSIHNTIHRLQQ